MNTSQAKVARIEGGRENVTLRTLEKAIVALEGRLGLSIAPAELISPDCPDWWSMAGVVVPIPLQASLHPHRRERQRFAQGGRGMERADSNPANRDTHREPSAA